MKIIICKHSDTCYLLNKQYMPNNIRIDGIEIDLSIQILPIQFDHLPVFEQIISGREIIGYINDVGAKITVDKYNTELSKLPKSDADGNFQTIDDEFVYRKFISCWKPEFQNYVKYSQIEVQLLYGNTKSEYDDIIPIYTITDNVNDELFMWNPNFVQYVKDIADKYGFIDAGFNVSYGGTKGRKYSFSRKESIEYMSVNGSFASYLYENYSLKNGNRKGSYEDLVAARKKAISIIDEYFNREYQKTNESKLNNVGKVIELLESIKSTVSSIDSKAATHGNKTAAIRSINSLIENLSK